MHSIFHSSASKIQISKIGWEHYHFLKKRENDDKNSRYFCKIEQKKSLNLFAFSMKGAFHIIKVWKSTVSEFKCKKSLSNYYSVRVIIVGLFKIKL